MRVDHSLKLRPFSHCPGTRCLVPLTSVEAHIFPAKIVLRDLAAPFTSEQIELPIRGPVKGFTVVQDLERARIEVFGHGAKGYFRYFISAKGMQFAQEKMQEYAILQKKKKLEPAPRFSFGVHKKQDWDLIVRRGEMCEVFPFWIRLAQLTPELSLPKISGGTIELLKEGRLNDFFEAGFVGILSPRFNDEHHLGLVPLAQEIEGVSPLGLIHEGARQIQKHFFEETRTGFSFLPSPPKEFHAGRCVGLITKEGDRIDFEWSKKELKKGIITPGSTREVSLHLQSQLKSFRLRPSVRGKGERLDRNAPLHLEEGNPIYLDQFQH